MGLLPFTFCERGSDDQERSKEMDLAEEYHGILQKLENPKTFTPIAPTCTNMLRQVLQQYNGLQDKLTEA